MSSKGEGAEPLYTVKQVADWAGVSPQTIRDWEHSGRLSASRTAGGQRRFTVEMRAEARRLRLTGQRAAKSAPPATSPESVEAHRLGALLRRVRLKAGLSQEETAAKVGVSRSFIASAEQGRTNVSVRVLAAIADAFGVHMGTFAPQTEVSRLVRVGEGPRTVLSGGVAWEELAGPGSSLEPALLLIPPGESSGGAVTRPGDTFIFVLEGQLEVCVGADPAVGDTYVLDVSDSLLVEAGAVHAWRGSDASRTRCLWVEQLLEHSRVPG